ncbi:MAG: AtpZ/AtpI family protein [Balneolaceae bacterium]
MFRDPELRPYLRHLSLGAEIAAGVTIPILLGYWLDSRFETSPWFLLIGLLFGILSLVLLSVRTARQWREEEDDT